MPMQMTRPGEAEADRTKVYVQNFTLAARVDTELHIEGEWLCLWRLLGTYPAAGDTYPLNYRYAQNFVVYVRFEAMDNPRIPLELGDIIRVPFKRLFLTTVAHGGAVPSGTFDLLYGKGPIELAKGEARQLLLMQDLLYYFEHGYSLTSAGGGAEVLTIGAATADEGADQACVEAILWTPDADMHFKIGTTDAAATDPLLPANACLTIPVNNTNLLQFYNDGAGNETVNIIYRS